MTLTTLAFGPQLMGLLFFTNGMITHYFPPKKINDMYGYRTTASKNNQQTWDVANRYAATYSIRAGMIVVVTGLLISFLIFDIMSWPGKMKYVINLIFTLGTAIGFCVFIHAATEKHIRETFKE